MREETQQLKALVGHKPFDDGVAFNAEGFGACPFHNGDGDKTMHLKRMNDSAWVATGFSACNQSGVCKVESRSLVNAVHPADAERI